VIELLAACFVVVDQLRMHKPQADIAKTAIAERFIGLLDGEFNLVCGTLDVAVGNFLGVEHHHINGDVLGFQLSAICIRKRHKTLWGCAAAHERGVLCGAQLF
jgi:hypothetical protein